MLKDRGHDLYNIFYHYSQCDPRVGTAKGMGGYYWREQDFTKFLRDFHLLCLFGRRSSIELYRDHSSIHSINNECRLQFEQFIWCMSSFANALPWSAGSTAEERTTYLLHSLDDGLKMVAKTRSPVVLKNSPKHTWMKMSKVHITKSGKVSTSSLSVEQKISF